MGAGSAEIDVVVIADTHLRTRGRLPPALLAAIEDCDLLLHAGDVTSNQALAELQEFAPTIAVLGNNDHDLADRLDAEWQAELGGVRVAMVHDSGERTRRAPRLWRRFPEAQLVIYGHSHIPDSSVGLNDQLLFNPGSPTQPRAQPSPSFGHLRLGAGRVLERSIVTLRRSAAD